MTTKRKNFIFLISGLVFIIAAAIFTILGFLQTSAEEANDFPDLTETPKDTQVYSVLTGEKISDEAQNSSPTYCIQIPNGEDGARPQAGLNEAEVVFEAVAERGITRFAAVFQNPESAVIGPIRSLRPYYLEWDTPFDCVITHAGGSAEALSAVANGYKNLDENYSYMYRGTVSSRLWNNLFTTPEYLSDWSRDNSATSANPTGFSRLTPEESEKSRIDATAVSKLSITSPTNEDTSALEPEVTEISLNLGWGYDSYNPVFEYNSETNSYDRYYASGEAHEVYACPSENLGEVDPESVCSLTQLSPNVVVALVVNEKTASDNYHEDITTTGSGTAYVFENGTVLEATWEKPTKSDQLTFRDPSGAEIRLAPGQTWLTAVPTYGSVDYN